MRRATSILLLTALLGALGSVACAGAGDTGDAATSADPAPARLSAEELGRLGGSIYAHPDAADALLENAGLTREQLEEQIERVAADPEASGRYRRAFEAVAGPAEETSTPSG